MTGDSVRVPGRTPGEDAEWDRNRAEEEPEMWDLAVADKARVPRQFGKTADIERSYDDFVEGLAGLVDEYGEYAVKRGVKLWLLAQLDDDAYALVETDDQGRYRDVLDGEVLWDPDGPEAESVSGTSFMGLDYQEAVVKTAMDIGRKYGWETLAEAVERLKREAEE